MSYELYNDDCLNILRNIPDNSVDVILCDLPYGTTPCTWDNNVNINELWVQYKRIRKETTPIILFGQEPFSSFLRLSTIKEYRYDWYWEKERLTNIFQVKYRPGKTIETISVFYKKRCYYNPQMCLHTGKPVSNSFSNDAGFSITQIGNTSKIKPKQYKDTGYRYPTQVLKFNRNEIRKKYHPTQKPISLLEFLIKTYSEENDVILDNCMGSGTTGVAALNLNRNFIGIEIDSNYFNIAKNRLESIYCTC